MKPSLCGRADLIRAMASEHEHDRITVTMSALLGYRAQSEARRERSLRSASVAEPSQISIAEPAPMAAMADVPFWRVETCEAVSLETSPPPRPTPRSTIWQRRPKTLPTLTSLAPKRVLFVRLRQAPVMRRTTSDLDIDVVVGHISRGEWLDRIPYRQRPAWGASLYIIEDRARRLVPYWRDQVWVGDQLADLYPSHGLTIARLREGDMRPVVRWPRAQQGQEVLPPPGALVVVLSDLGCLASRSESLRRFWRDWGQRLRGNQNPAVALVPAALRVVPPELSRVWTVVRWDMAASIASGAIEPVVQRLLTLLAPAVRMEPGLLRAVRCWLPEGRADAGLEAWVWQHMASQHIEAASWQPEQRKAYLARFAHEPEAVRAPSRARNH